MHHPSWEDDAPGAVSICRPDRWITTAASLGHVELPVVCSCVTREVGSAPAAGWILDCSEGTGPYACAMVLRAIVAALERNGTVTVLGASDEAIALARLDGL